MELDLDELPSLVTPFTVIVGWEAWQKRGQDLQRWLKANPLMEHYIVERHSLELTFLELMRYRKSRGRLPRETRTSQQYKLYSFMAMMVRVHERLGQKGKTRLEGILRHGLQSNDGLVPLQHEMETIAHLMIRGFDVQLVDLEQGGGFDFLATKGNAQAEVECKTVSGDLGRPVHHRQMVELSSHIFPVAKHAVESSGGGVLVTVTLSGRLTGQLELHRNLAAAVDMCLRTGRKCDGEGFCVSIKGFSLPGSPFADLAPTEIDQETVHDFVERKFNKANKHLFVYFRPNVSAIIIVVESRRPDKVLDGIYRQLKSASKGQFSKTRPAMLAVRLSDLTPGQLLDLGKSEPAHGSQPNGLQLIASRLFNDADRAHLHTVAYVSRGSAQRVSHVASDKVTRTFSESGPSYIFKNSNHPMANHADLSVFT